jgi:hypothetical protein
MYTGQKTISQLNQPGQGTIGLSNHQDLVDPCSSIPTSTRDRSKTSPNNAPIQQRHPPIHIHPEPRTHPVPPKDRDRNSEPPPNTEAHTPTVSATRVGIGVRVTFGIASCPQPPSPHDHNWTQTHASWRMPPPHITRTHFSCPRNRHCELASTGDSRCATPWKP